MSWAPTPCVGGGAPDRRNQNIIEWTPDGKSVIFAEGDHIRIVDDVEGAEVRSIVDMNPLVMGRYTGFEYGIYADLAPDGSKIVYGTCQYQTFGEEYKSSVENYRKWGFNVDFIRDYEIAVIEIDGSSLARLTVNEQQDNFPVWSPDGSRFAFYSTAVDAPGVIIMSAGRFVHFPRRKVAA